MDSAIHYVHHMATRTVFEEHELLSETTVRPDVRGEKLYYVGVAIQKSLRVESKKKWRGLRGVKER